MKLAAALQKYSTIVANGPLGTRLKYDYGYETTFDLTEQEKGRKILAELYCGDLNEAMIHDTPIILNAATFRASRNHLRAAKLDTQQDIKRINTSCINFVRELRNSYSNPSAPIFIGAPIGSMYDAYSVAIIPSIQEAYNYHQEQISIFKEIGVDFINAVTIPSLNEALGIAKAAAESGLDYTIGFILNEQATLLDGTPLATAINRIDTSTKPAPIGYLITCTHTSVIAKLTNIPGDYNRIIGIQPNGSNLSPEVLASTNQPLTDPPKEFAAAILQLKKRLNLKIIAGCCGTTREHLREIIQTCSP